MYWLAFLSYAQSYIQLLLNIDVIWLSYIWVASLLNTRDAWWYQNQVAITRWLLNILSAPHYPTHQWKVYQGTYNKWPDTTWVMDCFQYSSDTNMVVAWYCVLCWYECIRHSSVAVYWQHNTNTVMCEWSIQAELIVKFKPQNLIKI